MAKTGKKTFDYDVRRIEDIEAIIDYAKKRSDFIGIRANFDYKHDKGLRITVAGPKDKINLFEHQMRDFVGEVQEEIDF